MKVMTCRGQRVGSELTGREPAGAEGSCDLPLSDAGTVPTV